VLLDHEAVGIEPFKVRDIIAEDATATDAATTAGDSSSATVTATAAAGDGPSSDVHDNELYLATLTYSH
jgi:hypothetical protein